MKKATWLSTLSVSLAGGLLTASAFVCFLDPELSFRALFLSAVFPIAATVGLIAGFVAWPFVHFALRRTNLKISVPVLYLLTIIGTIISQQFALGPPFSLLFALAVCWLAFAEKGQHRNPDPDSAAFH